MTGPVKFLDIETVFREDARALLQLAYPPVETGSDVVNLDVMQGTQKDLEQYLSIARLDEDALCVLIAIEAEGKNRKGVLEVLSKAHNAITADPIPDKVKMIPELCEVVAIGYGTLDEVKGGSSVVLQLGSEKSLLDGLWRQIEQDMADGAKGPYGWRLSTFDIPVLIAASVRHGVRIPAYIQAGDRYRTNGFVDMASRRGWPGKIRDICLATGFEGDHLDPLKSGAGVASAWNEDRLDDIRKHCEVDLLRNHHVFELYNGTLW